MQVFLLIMSIIRQLPGIIQLIDQVVLSVEAAFPNASSSDKLKAATAKVGAVLSIVSTDASTISNLQTVMTPLINASVASFNAGGLFTSKPAPTAAQ